MRIDIPAAVLASIPGGIQADIWLGIVIRIPATRTARKILTALFPALFLITGSFLPAPASAQEALGEITREPHCFKLVNKAPFTVTGTVSTNFFIMADGTKTRHESGFRLEPGTEGEICTSGPFYPGRELELTLKSLMPVFSCKIQTNGNVSIYGEYRAEGGTSVSADCSL